MTTEEFLKDVCPNHTDKSKWNKSELLHILELHTEQLRKHAVISRFNSDTFIDNVCLSYRHDFGLMAEQDRQRLRFECKEWMRAISNNWEYFKNSL